jgi:hypothetical protein
MRLITKLEVEQEKNKKDESYLGYTNWGI